MRTSDDPARHPQAPDPVFSEDSKNGLANTLIVSDVPGFAEPLAENVRRPVGVDAQPDDDLGGKFVRGPVEGYGANGAALKAAAGPLLKPVKGLSSDSQGPRNWPR